MKRLVLLPSAGVTFGGVTFGGVALAGVALAGVALAAGCTSTTTAADEHTTSTSTNPTTTATPVAATPTSSAGSAAAECVLKQLAVTITGGDAGSTHRSRVVLFRNTGSAGCFLQGYPGVAALDAKGKQVDQAERTTAGYLGGLRSGKPPRVSLAPGTTASAMVEATAATSSGDSCTAYAGLLVTPPDETHSAKLTWGSDGCANLEIHPVVPGSTGSKG
jgi:hypothetical protein